MLNLSFTYLSSKKKKKKNPPTKKIFTYPQYHKRDESIFIIEWSLENQWPILFYFIPLYSLLHRILQKQPTTELIPNKFFYLKKKTTTQNHPLENIYLFYVFFFSFVLSVSETWVESIKALVFFIPCFFFFFICVFVDSRGEHEETWGEEGLHDVKMVARILLYPIWCDAFNCGCCWKSVGK